jgi:hypothetical protein
MESKYKDVILIEKPTSIKKSLKYLPQIIIKIDDGKCLLIDDKVKSLKTL